MGWKMVALPVALMEPLARRLPPAGGAAAQLLVMLKRWRLEVGVQMPRSVWAAERRKGEGRMRETSRGSQTGANFRDVESTSIDTTYNHLICTISDYYMPLVLGLDLRDMGQFNSHRQGWPARRAGNDLRYPHRGQDRRCCRFAGCRQRNGASCPCLPCRLRPIDIQRASCARYCG
jgi:hypothetical protein